MKTLTTQELQGKTVNELIEWILYCQAYIKSTECVVKPISEALYDVTMLAFFPNYAGGVWATAVKNKRFGPLEPEWRMLGCDYTHDVPTYFQDCLQNPKA